MPKEYVEWTWNPKQVAFIQTPKRFAAYVGGMGSGKTSALCRRAIAICQKYPGARGVLFRYTYTEVNNILVPQFMDILPRSLIKKWRRSEGLLEIKSGSNAHGAFVGDGISTILFRNLDDPKKFRSESLTFFGISQADDLGITEEHWNELCLRLRKQAGLPNQKAKQYGFLEANYRGHNWIWRTFTTEGQIASGKLNKDGSLIIGEDGLPKFDPNNYMLVEGSTYDNAENLPEEYLRDMEAMPEEFKKRHVIGSWDEFGGLVYEEFSPAHISDKFFVNGTWTTTFPEWWNKYRAIDHGVRNPTAALWATVSPSGTVYVYDEYYRPGVTREHAINIFRRYARQDPQSGIWMPTQTYKFTVIDRAAFNKEGTSGESPAQQFFDEGIPVVRAPKVDPASGIAVVKKYLSTIDTVTGRPKLQIHPRCHHLIREIKEYVWDELGPLRRLKRNEPERPRKLNDHLLDCLRYLLVCSPQPSPETPYGISVASRERTKTMYNELWEAV